MKLLRQSLRAILMLAACVLLFATSVQAAPADSILRGTTWLSGQIASNGTLQPSAVKTSLLPQAQSELIFALSAQGKPISSALVDATLAFPDGLETEILARKIGVAAIASRSFSSEKASLLNQQQVSRGWGLTLEHDANPLDTAYALVALAGNTSPSSVVEDAIGWLKSAQNADGGFGSGTTVNPISPVSSVFVTSEVVLAASSWRTQYDLSGLLSAAKTWLISARTGNRYSTITENASALLALTRLTSDTSVLQPLIDELVNSQMADGSWDGDVYTTALVVRALNSQTSVVPNPQAGSVQGTVLEDGSRQPLAGVTIQPVLVGGSGSTPIPSVASQGNGQFLVSNLQPGTYTITLGKLGYANTSVTVTVSAGQILQLGDVTLKPSSLTATLIGVISDVGGSPIAGALVSLGTASATTDVGGRYSLTGLVAGDYLVNVSAGSLSVSTTVTLVAGQTVVFSPRLGSSTSSDLSGVVVDANTLQPLDNVTVEVGSGATQTNAQGEFQFSQLSAGSFSLKLTKVGYQTATFSGQLIAGSNSVGSLAMFPGSAAGPSPSTATISGVVTTLGQVPIAGVKVEAGTKTATTDAKGAYQLTQVAPGLTTVRASAAGYETLSVLQQIQAGTAYIFSPVLMASGQPPAVIQTATLTGVVVDTTDTPIAGAGVVIGPLSVTTGVDGRFTIDNLAPGSVSVAVTATGYQSTTFSGTLALGLNDAGTLRLQQASASRSLSGLITDGSTKAPIAGAAITLTGRVGQVLSAADGRYTIDNITDAQAVISVSASGYASQTLTISFTQAGNARLDVALVRPAASTISIPFVRTNKPNYGPSEVVELEAELQNGSAQPAGVVVEADVRNAQNEVVYTFMANAPTGWAGQRLANQPILIPAAGLMDVPMDWFMLRQPAGQYQVTARAIDASGRVLAEKTTSFTVDSQSALRGGLSANPPVVQYGTQQPVTLSADFTNVGNQDIPAGSITVTVTLDAADASVPTTASVSSKVFASGSPLSTIAPAGLVADAAGNIYTVDSSGTQILKFAPNGQGSVLTTLAGINNWLIDLTMAQDGTLWVISRDSKLLQVKTDGQSLRMVQMNSLRSASRITTSASGQFIVTGALTGTNQPAVVSVSAAGVETVLYAGGLAEPSAMVEDGQGHLIVTNAGDHTLVKVSISNGQIEPFVQGLNRPVGITKDSSGYFYVANNADRNILKVSPQGQIAVYATDINDPQDLKFGSGGQLYVSSATDNAIYVVNAQGGVSLFAKGIVNQPVGMRYDTQGNLWVTNGDGTLRQFTTTGQVNIMASGISGPQGVAVDASGQAYVVSAASGTVQQVVGGTATAWISGLSGPKGVAVDGTGLVWVSSVANSSRGAGMIEAYNASGQLVSRAESLLNSVAEIKVSPVGDVYVRNYPSSITVRGTNGASRQFYVAGNGEFIDAMAIDPSTGLVVVRQGNNIYRLDVGGVPSLWAQLPSGFNWLSLAIDTTGNAYTINQGDYRIHRISPTGVISVFSQAPPAGVSPAKLGNGYNGALVALPSVGDNYFYFGVGGNWISRTAVVPSGTVYKLDVASDGGVLAYTYEKHLYHLSANTGAVLAELDDSARNSYIFAYARKPTGEWVGLLQGPDQLLESTTSTTPLQVVLSGYGVFDDITWTGSELLAVGNDSGLYRWNAASPYPIRHTSNFEHTGYLAEYQGVVFTSYGGNLQARSLSTGGLQWSVPDASRSGVNAGIAANANGVLLAQQDTSSVSQFSLQGVQGGSYGGLSGPQGLAVDAQGNLWAANTNGRNIVRFVGGSATPRVVAFTPHYPRSLAFDAQGQLWFSTWGGIGINRIDGTGNIVETLSSQDNKSVDGIALAAGQMWATSPSTQSIYRATGADLTPWLVALSGEPVGVATANDGSIWIASGGNGSIMRLVNQSLTPFANRLTGLNRLQLTTDGAYIGGSDGWVKHISPTGVLTDLQLKSLTAGAAVSGLLTQGANDLFVLAGSGSYGGGLPSILQSTVSKAVSVPRVGTVVHQVQVPMSAMPVGVGYQTVALGQWTPPYGGDFKLEAKRTGVSGTLTNMVHVGSHALGDLVVAKAELPPGDPAAPMCLRVDGADFTSVSRVEVTNIKPVAVSDFPKGLAANRAGTIYYLNSAGDTLFKAPTAQSQPIAIATGLSAAFGLAIDDQEQFYVASRDTGTGNFELLVIKEGSSPRKVVDLGVSRANGVVINPQGDVLVGSPGQLLRVTPQGQLTSIPTLGMPDPRGIAVDGKGTVYVQNDFDQLVAKIHPDGSATTLFSGGDGIDNPSFEGDGYPNIAADCAENFYIAPFAWEKIGQKSNEEHTLAQVIGRTGQATALFDTLTVSPTLSDVDFLSFDRLGNRILMWNHTDGKVWSVPVTCGAISVDAHLIAKPGQSFTSATQVPTVSIPLPDGRTEHVWSLKDVTASGVHICFDASQIGLSLGEQRQAIDSGYLSFKNSFAPNSVKVPLDIPGIHAGNLLAMLVNTDQPEYGPNSTAQIGSKLDNPNFKQIDGQIVLEVFDAQDKRVSLVTQQNISIPAKTLINQVPSHVAGQFEIKTILPGTYTVKGSLYVAGVLSAKAQTTFKVKSDLGGGGGKAFTTLRTDKSSYMPSERVQIDSTVSNTSLNTVLSDLRLVLDVRNAANTSVFGHTYPIAQLTAGALSRFSVGQQLSLAPAGNYTVIQTLLDSTDAVLHTTQASYVVSSNGSGAGNNLRGTLQATPSSIKAGQPVQLNGAVQNIGAVDFAGAKVSIVIINAITGAEVHRQEATKTLLGNNTSTQTTSWITPAKLAYATASAPVASTVASAKQGQARPTTQVQAVRSNSSTNASSAPLQAQADITVPHLALLIVTVNPGTQSQQVITLAQATFNVVQTGVPPVVGAQSVPIFWGEPGSLSHTLSILLWVGILGVAALQAQRSVLRGANPGDSGVAGPSEQRASIVSANKNASPPKQHAVVTRHEAS